MSSSNRSLHSAIRAWLLVILLHLGVSHGHAQTNAPGKIEAFAFNKMDVFTLFRIYQELSGVELELSPAAKSQNSRAISLISNTPVTKAEACKLIESALREQAGILITKIDDQRSSVTYDATLPIKIVTLPKPDTNSITSGRKANTNAPSLSPPPPPVPQKKN